jgi:hypothetical protein
MDVPEPWVMRRLREPLSSSGSARSAGVIESMITPMVLSCPATLLCSAMRAMLPMPGSFSKSPPMPPRFCIC